MFLQLTLVIQHVLFLVSFEHGLNKGFDRKKCPQIILYMCTKQLGQTVLHHATSQYCTTRLAIL